MKLHDCEVAHRHVRGCNAIFVFGPRALTADELAALAAEYEASYGAMNQPAYCSPSGWQLLHAAPQAPTAATEPEEPAAEASEIAAATPPIPAADDAAAPNKPPAAKKPAAKK